MLSQPRIARSLTDRVFGGVCGGLCAYLGINAWWGRAAFALLALLSGGVVGLLYLLLWWTLPLDLEAESAGPDFLRLLLVSAALVAVGAVTLARGLGVLSGPGGLDLFWPLVIVAVGTVFLWRTLRG